LSVPVPKPGVRDQLQGIRRFRQRQQPTLIGHLGKRDVLRGDSFSKRDDIHVIPGDHLIVYQTILTRASTEAIGIVSVAATSIQIIVADSSIESVVATRAVETVVSCTAEQNVCCRISPHAVIKRVTCAGKRTRSRQYQFLDMGAFGQ